LGLTLVLLISGCRFFAPDTQLSPIVVLTFDDQHYSVYDKAFPIMQEFGFRGTNFVNSAAMGQSGLMDWQHLQEMELVHGWETGGHTLYHEQLNQLDLEEARANIHHDFQNIVQNGLDPVSFALPRGQCPSQVYPIILDLYSNIRGSSDFSMYPPINRKALGYLSFQSSWSAEPVINRILRGIANNEALIIIGFHRFDAESLGYEDSCSSEVFRTILSFLQQKQLQVMPLKEAVDKLYQGK
jgi:peptidoglycan/xylan/chitin deacetylase (PgdA/CDA1 family)